MLSSLYPRSRQRNVIGYSNLSTTLAPDEAMILLVTYALGAQLSLSALGRLKYLYVIGLSNEVGLEI